uniref:Sporozoite-associated protein n=1 Tax=Anopheles gambiae TaxID=7165 RepID=SAP_ANOGA
MVNLCNLLLKYDHFSKVEDDIFIYIDRVLENASEIYVRQQKAKRELECLEDQLAEKQKQSNRCVLPVPRSPVKRRKVQSLDSPLSAQKENVSILEDSTIFPNKSDSDVSAKLELNILDSEEPFFALTQSPPPAAAPQSPSPRAILSPRNVSKTSPLRPMQLLFPEENKSEKKPLLRESRFGKSVKLLESSSVVAEKSNTPTTPKTTPNGKWTGKNANATIETSNTDHTPPSGLKRFLSLADSNQRFRQVKLNFPRQTKQSPMNEPEHNSVNDTLFSDFVVPTPPSVANKSKFLKSLRMKKQSTLISRAQDDKPGTKGGSDETSSSTAASNERQPMFPNDNDDDDIDQTYCPGVESTSKLSKGLSFKIKQEPESQQKERIPLKVPSNKKLECLSDHILGVGEDSESNEIIVLPAPSQQSVISVAESQNATEIFISELNGENAKRMDAVTIETNPSNVPRVNRELGELSGSVKPYTRGYEQPSPQGLCIDCTMLYQYHTTRGVSNDTARSKLPRNCRNCRVAQLHSTPPGFWDPDFLPTPE